MDPTNKIEGAALRNAGDPEIPFGAAPACSGLSAGGVTHL